MGRQRRDRNRKRGKHSGQHRRDQPKAGAEDLRVRKVPGEEAFELVYPHCVEERVQDMAEVHAMLDAGEIDLAVEELRWLLDGCRGLLEAHKLLGEIALSDEDLPLARGHLGYAYEMGLRAIPPEGLAGVLPCARPANQSFFEAGKGLAWCLRQSGEPQTARQVAERLIALDPTDPLGFREFLEPDRPGTLPIISF